MSRFSSSLRRLRNSVFDHKGDPAIYTSKQTGAPIRTTAIVYTDVETLPGGFESSATVLETHIGLPRSDVKNAKRGDKIAVGGKSYEVDDLASFGQTSGKIRVVVK